MVDEYGAWLAAVSLARSARRCMSCSPHSSSSGAVRQWACGLILFVSSGCPKQVGLQAAVMRRSQERLSETDVAALQD